MTAVRELIGARGVMVALGLLALCVPGLVPGLDRLEDMAFAAATRLQPAPEAADVRLVTYEVSASPGWMAELAQVLPQLRGPADRPVAVAVPAEWLPALQWTAAGRTLRDAARAERALLGVFHLGDSGWRSQQLPTVAIEPTRLSPYLQPLPGWAIASGLTSLDAAARRSPVQAGLVFPAASDLSHRPLIWRNPDGAPALDLSAGLALSALGSGPAEWLEGLALQLPGRHVVTDLSGRVRVHPDLGRQLAAIPLGAVAGQNLETAAAITVAPADGGRAVAATTAAVIAGSTVATPWWSTLAGRGLLLLAVIYAAALLPRLSPAIGVLLTVVAMLGVLAGELGLYLVEGLWAAWTVTPVYLALALPLAQVARRPRAAVMLAETERDRALRRLAAYQLEQGDPEAAYATLQPCRDSDEVLELLYQAASALERRRRYPVALEVFEAIEQRRRGYRDVRQHLKSLRSGGEATVAVGQTLVMDGGDTLVRPVIGRYEVVREIGRGATGVVYLGRDPKIAREVAIKTLAFAQFEADELETFKSRFTREAEAAGRLDHPNIVTVYDVGEESDLAFIAMEYAAGRTLAHHTREGQLLAVATVMEVLAQVADALDYAHDRGIVHRDIKPGNIIYDAGSGRVKVTDFGIARLMDSSRTRTGSVLGTPSYMAPEQLTGGDIDGRTDIFSLGVTLYQLITGEVPFKGENMAGIAYQITNTRHTGVRSLRPELPAAAPRIVNKALQKNAEKRYQSAAEMAEELRKAGRRLSKEKTG